MISKILAFIGLMFIFAATVSLLYNITGIEYSPDTLDLYAQGCVMMLPASIKVLWKAWKEVRNDVE